MTSRRALTVDELAARLGEPVAGLERTIRRLEYEGLVEVVGGRVWLTDDGWRFARPLLELDAAEDGA